MIALTSPFLRFILYPANIFYICFQTRHPFPGRNKNKERKGKENNVAEFLFPGKYFFVAQLPTKVHISKDPVKSAL